MNCRDLQTMIPDFIESRLTDEQLEIFLNHIAGCRECYDELEVYYMITTGLMQLDEDHTGTLDLKKNLRNLIEEQNKGLYLRKRMAVRKKHFRVFFAIAMVCFVLFAGHILLSSEEKIRSMEDFKTATVELIQRYVFGEEPEEPPVTIVNPVECRMNFERMHPLIPHYFYYTNVELPASDDRIIYEKDGEN